MIAIWLKLTILTAALVMAVTLFRARHDKICRYRGAGPLALAGSVCIALAKTIDVASVIARYREAIGSRAFDDAQILASGIIIVGVALFTVSLVRWLSAGRHLTFRADVESERAADFRSGYRKRGLALDNVPAVLYSASAPLSEDNVELHFFNNRIEEMLGYTRKELETRPELFREMMHPDDLQDYEDKLVIPIRQMPRMELTHRFRHKDGSYRWIRRYLLRIENEHGGIGELIGCALDVTKQKEAENRLRKAVDSAPDAILAIDQEGRIQMASGRAVERFGYTKDELLDSSFEHLVSADDRQQVTKLVAMFDNADEDVTALEDRELLCQRKGGDVFAAELSTSWFESPDDLLMAISVRDISSRKEAESRLRQTQKMEAIGRLTGGIAHDFNNLLTVIVGNLQMIDSGILDGQSQASLSAAQKGVDSAASLTSHLLAFSRQQSLEPTIVNANVLINDIDFLTRRALGDDIALDTRLTENPWPVRIDPGQLESALINLAINARDAMSAGGCLTIETTNLSIGKDEAFKYPDLLPGDYLRLSVADSGAGIPADALPRIFEPFFTTKEESGGSGLGLSMVYGFVRQSAGHIDVYSKTGKGTTVVLYLPRAEVRAIDQAASADIQNGVPTGRERILVVDDNEAIRTLLGKMLASLDYDVAVADSGGSAMELVGRQGSVDLLFTDIIMPGGMTGGELAERLRRRIPALKVLYTSGHDPAELQDNEMVGPHDAIICKPYKKAQLAHKVREVLDGRMSS